MFDAVIFDLDGTLVDTERLSLRAGIAAFANLGHAIDPAFLHGLVGIDDVTGRKLIKARYPEVDLAAVDSEWIAASDRIMAQDGLALKHGVLELLAHLSLPCAIATSSTRVRAAKKLRLSGLATCFQHVITLDDVAAAKPDPEPYLLAAARMGVDTARCIAFEDSEAGAQSAHRAGMCVVQVPDVGAATGKWAHHLAGSLLEGARAAGLIG